MDAENDNDQPNSSSASASTSSSNNSSSSNLLGHLPMLPFMRSTDDDEPVAVADHLADGNDNHHHHNDDNNDLNEEPMPLQPPPQQQQPQPPVTQAMAMATASQSLSALVLQPTMAPITTTATAATGAGTSTASSTSSVGREEPMVGAEQLAVLSSSSSASSLPLPQPQPPSPSPTPPLSSSALSSPNSTSYFATTTSSHTTHLPPSAFLPSANPSQVIFSPFLFDMPAVVSSTNVHDFNKSPSPSSSLPPPLPPPFFPSISSQTFTQLMSPISDTNTPPLTSSSPSSSGASSSSPSSSSTSSSLHSIHYNLAQQSQLSLFHEQVPIPTTSFSISSQQQQQSSLHQASSPPTPQPTTSASNIIESTTVVESPSSPSSLLLQHTEHTAPGHTQQQAEQVVEQQQLTAQIINRNDIADTIDASAVIVQPLETNADEIGHQPHIYPQEAASEAEVEQQQHQNNIQLDDNDNNDFDVDLNIRNDEAVAVVASSSSSASVAAAAAQQQQHEQQQQLQQTQSLALDTSASGSAGPSSSSTLALGQQQQQQTPQLPTTLPLLLQQQQQPSQQQLQQTEESKHLPSFDHHYHNPREFHLHAHPYQHPCVYPYGFRANSPSHNNNNSNNNNTNGAHNITGSSLNTNSIMFGNSMSSDHRNHGSSTSGLGGVVNTNSSPQVVDRLKMLYPNVNENETPLPRCWSPHDKCLSIGLSQNNLRVHFKGVGKQSNDAASVRTAHPIPPACGIYYFEVEIISKGKNGYMGIGLTAQQFRMNRLPGWDKQSYGYHGDDGNSFSSSGHGQSYGPTFTTGDIIGCCVNFVNNTCFYTKNGIDLGIAFRDLPNKLYPTVGLQTPGEEVDANFGQEPFKFDQIEDMMKQMRAEMTSTIYDFPLPAEQGDPTTLLQKLVSSYLVHNGYSQTAEAFSRQKTGQNLREDISSIRNRQRILKLVMSGKIGQAIEQTLRSYPGLLENNKNLWFMLKIRQFIEMINGSDIENGNGPSTSSNGSLLLAATTDDHPTTSGSSTIALTKTTTTSTITTTNNTTNNNNNNSSSTNNITTANNLTTTTIGAATAVTVANSPTAAAVAAGLTVSSSLATATTTTTSATPVAAATTILNAQNSSHMTVIHTDNDMKTQTNLVEHCSATNDAPSTIGKCNNDNDYLNDVEMENNGQHTTNGNVCKNGNTNNFNDSIDADEEMDVDVSPAIKNFSHGIERILEFGKELSKMGTQLDKEKKMSDDEKRMMENAFSLIAYSNPWASPLGWQLCPSKREPVCRALNSAILESMNYPKMPPLEYCVAHANELLKVMAQASLGACAFVNIADVFPKN